MTTNLLQSLPHMSLAISVIVIVCMSASFAALVFLYGRAKSQAVSFGAEDAQLKNKLYARFRKCAEEGLTAGEFLAKRRKSERTVRIVSDVLFLVMIGFVLTVSIFAIVFRAQGEQFFFGDTTYLTVYTGSMQEKNENNAYLAAHDDGVRIHQYALIGIQKTLPDALKEGDIIAFTYENDLYVHRIVEITESGGERLFTTMGDANATSFGGEIGISADRIVGKFNGYHAGFLGVLLIYMQSDIGIIALIFVLLLLAVFDLSERLVARSYEKRLNFVAAEIDGEEDADV